MHEQESEPLIPGRTGVPLPNRSWLSPWMAAGILCAIAFVGLSRIHVAKSDGDIVNLMEYHPALYRAFFAFHASNAVLQIAAIIAVWVALVRPGWSDRLLWCAATTLSASLVIVAGLPRGLFRDDFATIAMIGFTSWAIVAWYSSMPLAWRAIVSAACIAMVAFACALPFLAQLPPIYFAGSLVLACSIWCFSIALVAGFRIDLFEPDQPFQEREKLLL
jgi:hypothetical protein